MSSLVVRAYLIAYNVAQTIGWTLIFVKTARCLLEHDSTSQASQRVYEQVGWLVGSML